MRKIKLLYQTSFLLLLGLLLNACFKPEEILIDQETKDYCLFAEGSYWIYQDSASYIIDSAIINQPVNHILFGKGGYDMEKYSTNISFYSQDGVASREATLISTPKCCELRWSRVVIYHDGEVFEGSAYSSLILAENRANYSINGVTYSNVKIFKINEKIFFYWVKHVGLIRTEISENDSIIVKNLIRYNVKQ